MKRIKQGFAFFLTAAFLVLLLASCQKAEVDGEEAVSVTGTNGQVISVNRESVFKLPYTRSDSMNPYFAETLNNQTLATLLFDSLFRLDAQFVAQPLLATDCRQEEQKLTVTIGSGIKFSDGSALTAADVVYSFDLAKKSPAYAVSLAGLTAAQATDNLTVVFTAAAANPYAKQLLTFPVVKQNTGAVKTDLPVGTGRFILKSEGLAPSMKPNGFYTSTPAITQIELVNAQSESEIENALHIGKISFIYNDLGTGSKGSGNAQTTAVPLNNLVYLGFNPQNTPGQSSLVRQAVSYALNRREIVANTFHSFATPATSPFNPLWPDSEQAQVAAASADLPAAQMALKESGYASGALKLLVNSDNSYRKAAADLIAKQLGNAGFHVTVDAKPYDAYRQALAAGAYDLFLGEVRLTDDMNLNCFFTPEGNCAFSVNPAQGKTSPAYAAFVSGKEPVGSFLMAFKEEMPFVPVLYRKGLVAYTSLMKVKPESIYSDVFQNIEQWTF